MIIDDNGDAEIDQDHRKVKVARNTKNMLKMYHDIDDAVDDVVDRFIDRYQYYAQVITQKSNYECIRYDVGGFYAEHVDIGPADDENSGRKLAVYLYLNDCFTGGHLKFPYQDVEYAPMRGDIIVFDAGALHPHSSSPIEDGCKLVVTTWLS